MNKLRLTHRGALFLVLVATPPLLADEVVVNLRSEVTSSQILSGAATVTWSYRGEVTTGPASTLTPIPNSYLGPVIRVNTGDHFLAHHQNDLPEETTTHWHGLDVSELADGHPKDAFEAGASYDYEFIVRNRAGTYWYHPHPDMLTGKQVYKGLAGFFIISDPAEQALDLPRGEFDVPLCIQDANFDAANQLDYTSDLFFGDTTLVNGQASYNYSAATRIYRLRILNGSQSRILKLGFDDGASLTLIGVDGGLLDAPVVYPYIMLGPGERIELWVDFSGKSVGDVITLQTQSFTVTQDLNQGVAENLMTFTIDRQETETLVLPQSLVPMGEVFDVADVSDEKDWSITFNTTTDVFNINGGTFSMTGVAANEEVTGDALEMITTSNNSPVVSIAHPMHYHGRQFQIYSRTVGAEGLADYDTVKDGLISDGWKDTYVIMPFETVKFLVRFSRHPGLFVYHCHNLIHEDEGMMRNFNVSAPPCPGDLTHDAQVNLDDLLEVLGGWSTPFGDVTGDDKTTIEDLLAIFADWGQCG
jgi:FtsP/CotA-like multicopper oxidase with cupredoxin domain